MEMETAHEHDQRFTPSASAMADDLAREDEVVKRKIQLRNQGETSQLKSWFELQRHAGSGENIRFYTRWVHVYCNSIRLISACLSVWSII